MAQDSLIRIGKGVPGADHGKRKLKPQVYWVLAAAVIIAVGLMVSAVYFWDPPSREPTAATPSLPVAVQMECESIRHQHELWAAGRDELDRVPQWSTDIATIEVKTLAAQGKTFLDAATGYKDAPVLALAVAIAQYNVDIGTVHLFLQVGDQFDRAAYDKAVGSWIAAEQSYGKFRQLTCGAG